MTDEQGGALPGATIVLRQVETNATRTGVTENGGQYYLPSLPAGRYELTIELQGLATAKREIGLRVGQDATLDIGMRIAAVAETVLVSGESAVVESRATVGSPIDRKEIDNLPTLTRDFAELAKVAPGITSTGSTDPPKAPYGERTRVRPDGFNAREKCPATLPS